MHLFDAAFYFSIFAFLGIFSGTVFEGGFFLILGAVLLLSLFLFFVSFITKEKKFWLVMAIFSLFIFPGYLYGKNFKEEKQGVYPNFSEFVYFSGEAEKVTFKGGSQIFYLKLERPYQGKIKIYTDIFSKIEEGDKVEAEGVIEVAKNKETVSYFPKIKTEKREKTFNFLNDFREKILKGIRKALPSLEAELAAGIILGERGLFSSRFKENLNASGTTHIVALSGYNITILVLAIDFILGYFLSRKSSFIFSILAIIFFVLMTGGEASIIRAAIMGIIGLLAVRFERLYSARNAIAIAAFLMAIYNPLELVEPGFQMSFLSLIGIVYFMPALKNIFGIKNEKSFLDWKKNLLTTLAAQAAVVPVALYFFKSFSIFSFISNIAILEFIPYAMLFSFLTGFFSLFGFWGGFLSWLFSFPAYFILKMETGAINFFGEKAGFLFKTESFGIGAVFIYYLLMIFLIYNFYREREEN